MFCVQYSRFKIGLLPGTFIGRRSTLYRLEAEGKLYQFTQLPFGVTNGVSFFQRFIDNIIAKYDLGDTYAYLDNITVCGNTMKDRDHNLKALFFRC